MSALPIFPGRLQPSIVGAGELNCRVRNGYGWTLTPINTDLLFFEKKSKQKKLQTFFSLPFFSTISYYMQFSSVCQVLSDRTPASNFKPTKCLKFEAKRQRRKCAFTLAWKQTIRTLLLSGDPCGNRTHVCGVRGRRLNRLTNGPWCAFSRSVCEHACGIFARSESLTKKPSLRRRLIGCQTSSCYL